MARPSKYPRELRERAVRAVAESMEQRQYPSEFEAIRTIAGKLGIGSPETLRKWVRQAEVDGGTRPGRTTQEIAEELGCSRATVKRKLARIRKIWSESVE